MFLPQQTVSRKEFAQLVVTLYTLSFFVTLYTLYLSISLFTIISCERFSRFGQYLAICINMIPLTPGPWTKLTIKRKWIALSLIQIAKMFNHILWSENVRNNNYSWVVAPEQCLIVFFWPYNKDSYRHALSLAIRSTTGFMKTVPSVYTLLMNTSGVQLVSWKRFLQCTLF